MNMMMMMMVVVVVSGIESGTVTLFSSCDVDEFIILCRYVLDGNGPVTKLFNKIRIKCKRNTFCVQQLEL